MSKITHSTMMSWKELDGKWHLSENGHFRQEFYPCEVLAKYFPELNKSKPCFYKIAIEKISREEYAKNST